ncbi:hypothetical protein NA57DRAFT_53453 [Rhizodiscina lignyota]|uniref:F-box domain-containing protein n=1 Tax=Rhizodiscina lignyota TaxID=1504668 RepID=A0A9P4M8D2_9PEZI|nr:hypothetical protein NA57DRAFT_53453 [Rhizodiscina lignyota]
MPSPFLLSLPSEIRLQIYEHLFTDAIADWKICCDDFFCLVDPGKPTATFASVISLRQTCQLIRRETEGLFFKLSSSIDVGIDENYALDSWNRFAALVEKRGRYVQFAKNISYA